MKLEKIWNFDIVRDDIQASFYFIFTNKKRSQITVDSCRYKGRILEHKTRLTSLGSYVKIHTVKYHTLYRSYKLCHLNKWVGLWPTMLIQIMLFRVKCKVVNVRKPVHKKLLMHTLKYLIYSLKKKLVWNV